MSSNIPTIALAGNPNSGKTSLFNAITGLKYKVGNYPGVTVDKKVGKFNLKQDLEKNSLDAEIYDLPGIYSLSGCLLYTSPSPRDKRQSRMPSSA